MSHPTTAISTLTHGLFSPLPQTIDLSSSSSLANDLVLSTPLTAYTHIHHRPIYHISILPHSHGKPDIVLHRTSTPKGAALATATFHTLQPTQLRAARDPFVYGWGNVESARYSVSVTSPASAGGPAPFEEAYETAYPTELGEDSAYTQLKGSFNLRGKATHSFASWLPSTDGIEEFTWEDDSRGEETRVHLPGHSSQDSNADSSSRSSPSARGRSNSGSNSEAVKCIRRSDGQTIAVGRLSGQMHFLDQAVVLGEECRILTLMSFIAIMEKKRRSESLSLLSPSAAMAMASMKEEGVWRKVKRESLPSKVYMPSDVLERNVDSPLNRCVELKPSLQLGMSASLRSLCSPGLVL